MRLFTVVSFLALVTLGCSGGTTAPPGPPPPPGPGPQGPVVAGPPVPKAGEPGFFAWYNPGRALYHSTPDAAGWAPVGGAFPADLTNWYVSLASDAGGRLYAGKSPAVLFHSEDAGKTWTSVAQTATLAGNEDFRFCAGAADELFAVGSGGTGLYSTDAGQSWIVRRVAAEGARGAGDGFTAGCAFSSTGELLVDAWYFDPPGPVTATSADKGVTWTSLPRAASNTSTDGLGYVGTTIFYAQHGGYTGAKVSRFDAAARSWTETGELKGAPDREWALSAYATDGQRIVGWENPGKSAAGAVKGYVEVSTDGGTTFTAAVGPVLSDPTPDLWDEYLAIGWHNGRTPGPMPAAKPEAKTTHGARPPDSALPKAPQGLQPAKQPDNGRPSGNPKSPSLEELRKKH